MSKRFATSCLLLAAVACIVVPSHAQKGPNPPKIDVSEYSVIATIFNLVTPNGPGSPSNTTVGPGLLAYSESLKATVQGQPADGLVQLTFQNDTGVFTYSTFGPPGTCNIERQPEGLNYINMNPQAWIPDLNFVGMREKNGKHLMYYNSFDSSALVFELWTHNDVTAGKELPVYAAISSNVPLFFSIAEYTFNSVDYSKPSASLFNIPAACHGL